MENEKFVIPKYITSSDIKDARKKLGLTQQEFAAMIGCSKPTVARWETEKEKILGPIVSVVYLINNELNRERLVLPEMHSNLRLLYMYKQNLCTVIDVDELNEQVTVSNYTSNITFRAFGHNASPTYSDYLEFLESRCFPNTRDKIKIELEKLGLPFYDSLMIIEKTSGRMAEDDFWIKVERR